LTLTFINLFGDSHHFFPVILNLPLEKE